MVLLSFTTTVAFLRFILFLTVTGKATLEAQDFMESDYCQLKSEEGDITASRIKTSSLNVSSKAGDIHLGGQIQVRI